MSDTNATVTVTAMQFISEHFITQCGLSLSKHVTILWYLLLEWRPSVIAEKCGVTTRTVQHMEENLLQYSSTVKPQYWALGCLSKLTEADKKALLDSLLHKEWRYQDEMMYWLWNEWGVYVSQPIISCVLKQNNWTRKQLWCMALNWNEELREGYKDDMCQFEADDLVFLDESIFNKQTDWRHQAYMPIENEAWYDADVRWGWTWSICAAMTINDWLNCTDIKQGYFNADEFYIWLCQIFLSTLWLNDQIQIMMVIMNNNSVHIEEQVVQAVQTEGHLICFLSFYSSDFNSIELTFSVLKAWVKWHYHFTRESCSNFDQFLEMTIEYSHCDHFAQQHFQHLAGGIYIEQKELEWLQEQLRAFEQSELENYK